MGRFPAKDDHARNVAISDLIHVHRPDQQTDLHDGCPIAQPTKNRIAPTVCPAIAVPAQTGFTMNP